MIAPWPEPRPPESWEETKLDEFGLVQDVVRAVRNLRSEKKVPPGKRISAVIVSAESADTLNHQRETISALAGIEEKDLGDFEGNRGQTGKPHRSGCGLC